VAATASPDDVRELIATDRSRTELSAVIDRAHEKHAQVNDPESLSETVNKNVESYLAALILAGNRDRAVTSEQLAAVQKSYDGSTVAWLKRELDFWDPSGQLAFQRETARYVGSADMS
jgi:hypothetical protein